LAIISKHIATFVLTAATTKDSAMIIISC